MVNYSTKALLGLLAIASLADAYWRMSCSIIQTGRVDPIIAPGRVAAHTHKVSGASNFGISATYDDLQASRCSSCEVQDDKSAYWTPQLFFQHSNGSFQLVPNGGTVVYYLGRGENRSNIEPFPPGFKMLSGDSTARSADTKTMTYSKTGYKGRPVAERISFACLDSSGPSKERNFMWKTDCDNGMRAQVHFQTCWNGGDYQPDQSHVAYLSQIDNGICPPSHPCMLPHLFLEVIYGVNNVDKSKGGKFVFANGDTTGYGFHGDFLNGWDMSTLKGAIKTCINNDAIGGAISKCPILASSQTPFFSDNCPEMPPIVNETTRGMLDKLPGCNQVTSGPAKVPQSICATQPPLNDLGDMGIGRWFDPSPGDKVGSWAYVGCAAEGVSRTLNKYTVTSDIMSIEYCTAACKEQGYPLAGMENGRECYCASALTSGASYMKASLCAAAPKMICSGNMTQYCGGPNMLTIWSDTAYTPPVELVVGSTKIAKGAGTYQGCYSEPSSGRALSSDRTADTTGMTNEMCVAFCQAGGYLYAGTEYAQECYCGNTIGGDVIPDISQCSMQCKGNIFSYCGAGNKLSVWKITQPEKPSGPITAFNGAAVYTGCYTDGGPGGRTLPGAVFTGSSVSLDTCFAFCKKLNFPLFGMEYGRECYCGYAPKTQSSIAPDGDCKMPCAGDASQKCGAGNRISIWNNTLYTPMASPESFNIQPKYLGCYTEGKKDLALNKAKTPSNKMTVEVCANFCSGKGLAYMGLENGQDCYCSNAGPSSGSVEAPEKECSMVCKGNKNQKCGAAERLNVYKVNAIKNSAKPVQAKVQDFSPTTLHRSKTTTTKAVNVKAKHTTTAHPAKKGKTSSTTKAVNKKAKHTTTTHPAPKAKKTSSSKAVNKNAKPTASHRVAAKAKAQATSKAQAKVQARPTSTSKAVRVQVKQRATAKVQAKKTTVSPARKAKTTSTVVRPKAKASSTTLSTAAKPKARKTHRALEPEVTAAPSSEDGELEKRKKGNDDNGAKNKNKGKGKGKGKDDDDSNRGRSSTRSRTPSASSATKTEDSRKGKETKRPDDRRESRTSKDPKAKKTSTTSSASVTKTEDHKKGRPTKAPGKGESEKSEKGEKGEKQEGSKESKKSKTSTTRPTRTRSTATSQPTKDSKKGNGHERPDDSRNKKNSKKPRFVSVTRISGARRRSASTAEER